MNLRTPAGASRTTWPPGPRPLRPLEAAHPSVPSQRRGHPCPHSTSCHLLCSHCFAVTGQAGTLSALLVHLSWGAARWETRPHKCTRSFNMVTVLWGTSHGFCHRWGLEGTSGVSLQEGSLMAGSSCATPRGGQEKVHIWV